MTQITLIIISAQPGEQVDNSVGRVVYQTNAAINYEFGINAMYPINKRWVVMGIISRTKLDNNIVNSPLIDLDYRKRQHAEK